MILQKRHDEFQDRLDDCQAKIKDKKAEKGASASVKIMEVSKAQVNKSDVNEYMCSYTKPGASLQTLLLNAFAKGWLSLSDFSMSQTVTVAGVKDTKGKSFDNGFMFNGWKLIYDNGPLSIGNVLGDGKDAHLVAWTYAPKTDVKDAANCLKADEGSWNQ